MAKTLREKFTARLLELGAKEVPSRSSKYKVFEYTFTANNKEGVPTEFTRFVFLGAAGAVRWNSRQSYDGSISQPSYLMKQLNAAQARAEGFKQEVA